MMGPGHRALGAVFGLGYGMTAGLPAWQTITSAGIASVFAAGRWFSPDCDQHFAWRVADDLLPDELLDRARYARGGKRWSPSSGGPMQHRGITHWWGCQAFAVVVLAAWAPWYWWALGAVIAGWCSHLFGDFVFGMPDPYTGRGGGVPLMPWWRHVGLELDTGGPTERLATKWVLPVVLFMQGLWLVGLGPRIVEAASRTLAGG